MRILSMGLDVSGDGTCHLREIVEGPQDEP
jgi:hypothetical protein